MTEQNVENSEQVKFWRTYCVCDTYDEAVIARNRAKNDDPRDVKIRHRARGFMVKVWDGHMVAAPKKREA